MGKKIIIKGADFSADGMEAEETLYLYTYTQLGGGSKTPTAANGGWAFGTTSAPFAGLVNKKINFVRFMSKKAGTLNFYRCTDPTDITTRSLITTVTVPAPGQVVTHFFEPITLGNEYFVIGEPNSSQGLPGYEGSGSTHAGPWIGKIPNATPSVFNSAGIRIDVGYKGY